MKKKSKNAKPQKVKDFRFHNVEFINKKGSKTTLRHPTFVFLKKGNIYIYVSLTHSKSVPNVMLIKLRKNPNPKDKSDSYFVDKIKEDVRDKFGKRLANWRIDPLDDDLIREKYKKR